MTFAIDFDGTLCDDEYPNIGAPHHWLIETLINMKRLNGDKLILWTCRTGERLQEAVDWCKARGLEFDAVNDHLPETKAAWAECGPKVGANYYIDDRAINANQLEDFFYQLLFRNQIK